MALTLAMAGLGEAAAAFSLLVGMTWLLLCGVLAVMSMLTNSRRAVIASWFLMLPFTLLFTPWVCFAPLETTNDPDVEYWHARYQMLVLFWMLTLILVAFSAIRIWNNPKSAENTKSRRRQDVGTFPCPNCGRMNAASTAICPRCMLRLTKCEPTYS